MLDLEVSDQIMEAAKPYYVTLGEYEAARHQVYFCFDRNWDESIDTHPPGTNSWFVINDNGDPMRPTVVYSVYDILSPPVHSRPHPPLEINVNRAHGWYVSFESGTDRLPTFEQFRERVWRRLADTKFDAGLSGARLKDIPRDTLIGIRGPMIKIEDAFRIGVFDVTPSPPPPPRPARQRRQQRRQRR